MRQKNINYIFNKDLPRSSFFLMNRDVNAFKLTAIYHSSVINPEQLIMLPVSIIIS